MKKLVALCILAVLGLSLQSVAVVLGNFENAMDGWEMQNGATGTYSTEGVTNGASALEVVFPAGWVTVLKHDMKPQIDVMKNMTEITVDLTTRNDNNQISGWWLDVILIVNSETGGWTDMGNKYTAGVPWGPRTETLTWTIPQSVRDAFILNEGGGWAELFLVTNTSGASNTFWVDNIQATVPEPATLSMLGLGALALLKRRKA